MNIRAEALPRSMLTLASVAIVVAALYLAKGVLVPLTLAVLLSFLLAPLCDAFERWHIHRVPAVVLTAVIAFSFLGLVAWVVTTQLTELAGKLPEYHENIKGKSQAIAERVGSALGEVTRTTDEISRISTAEPEPESAPRNERTYPVRLVGSAASPLQIMSGIFGTLLEVLGTAGIVIVFVIFFLIRREDLRDRFIRLVSQGQVTVTTQALEDAARRVSHYLGAQLAINVSFGIPVAVGLWLLGVPNALLWGLLATVLRFIPYIGPWVAAALPIALSLAISPGWTTPALTIGMFLILELFTNNVVEPWMYGARTGVSPVAVLVSAVFWTWLWGGVGLLLATPLTVCLVVIGKYVPQLSFLNVLLGDQPVFDMQTRVYQRLLAGDQEEAVELIEQELANRPLAEVYDSILLPALGLAERDRHRGDLDEWREQFIYRTIRDTVDELGEQDAARGANAASNATSNKKAGEGDSTTDAGSDRLVPSSSQVTIVCLPARDEADEIAATMLAQLLQQRGVRVQTVSETALASEMIEKAAEHGADLICVSAVPPSGTVHARYLCKRLLARFPDISIVVGLWHTKAPLDKARERIACGDSVSLVTSLAEAQEQIRRLIQPLVIQPMESDRQSSSVLRAS
jgi:predicted PurR-regulated permease PerM